MGYFALQLADIGASAISFTYPLIHYNLDNYLNRKFSIIFVVRPSSVRVEKALLPSDSGPPVPLFQIRLSILSLSEYSNGYAEKFMYYECKAVYFSFILLFN